MGDRFDAWRGNIEGSPERDWIERLLKALPESPDILELGCGGGTGATPLLAARGRLTGVDVSAEQIRRANERVPGAAFVHADMTELELPRESFDAAVSVYAFNHVPKDDLPRVLERIAGWLRPGGLLLASFGISGGEGVEEDWLGVPMFFASHTEAENTELLRAAGLEPELNEVVTIVEPEEGEARFQWVLASKGS